MRKKKKKRREKKKQTDKKLWRDSALEETKYVSKVWTVGKAGRGKAVVGRGFGYANDKRLTLTENQNVQYLMK